MTESFRLHATGSSCSRSTTKLYGVVERLVILVGPVASPVARVVPDRIRSHWIRSDWSRSVWLEMVGGYRRARGGAIRVGKVGRVSSGVSTMRQAVPGSTRVDVCTQGNGILVSSIWSVFPLGALSFRPMLLFAIAVVSIVWLGSREG